MVDLVERRTKYVMPLPALAMAALVIACSSGRDDQGSPASFREDPVEAEGATNPPTQGFFTRGTGDGTGQNGRALGEMARGAVATSPAYGLPGATREGQPVAGLTLVHTGFLQNGAPIDATGLTFDDGRSLVITSQAWNGKDDGGFVYDVSVDGQRLCPAGDAIPLPGVWGDDGTFDRGDGNVFTWACGTYGAIGKCFMFGYDPSIEGESYHEACTRALRADYCGDGDSYTTDGYRINLWDRKGVLSDNADWPQEAVWMKNGATCISRENRTVLINALKELPPCLEELPLCKDIEHEVGSDPTWEMITEFSRRESTAM